MQTNVHVTKHADGWHVKEAGSDKSLSTHPTKEKALEAGRTQAKKNKSELVIHNENGTIIDSDSYGNDPRSVKDKVH